MLIITYKLGPQFVTCNEELLTGRDFCHTRCTYPLHEAWVSLQANLYFHVGLHVHHHRLLLGMLDIYQKDFYCVYMLLKLLKN